MSAQNSYNFATERGVAGGLYDLSPYAVETRRNESADGVIKFGMGVVVGTAKGNQFKLPSTTTDKFEGIVLNGFSNEHDMAGNIAVKKGAVAGVLSHGKAWARIKRGITVAYGDEVYLYVTGANAGLFSNAADSTNTMKIDSAKFIGAKGTGDVAPVEIN